MTVSVGLSTDLHALFVQIQMTAVDLKYQCTLYLPTPHLNDNETTFSCNHSFANEYTSRMGM